MTQGKNETPLTSEEYVKAVGQICPNCGAIDTIECTGPLEADGDNAWQNVYCRACNAEWVDIYQLKGYDNLEVPPNRQAV